MQSRPSLKVLILIGRFDVGGIQRQVMTTAAGLVERGHQVRVLAIYPAGRFAAQLRDMGVDVRSLDRRSRGDVGALWRGARQVRGYAPDVLYSYHVLPNVVAVGFRALHRRTRLVWGLRATDLHRHGFVKRTQFRLSRWLARVPDAIVANSHAVRDFHVAVGYPADAVTVIPNGIDTRRFRPDAAARAASRRDLGLDAAAVAIGVVAQLRGKKGHLPFLHAFRGLSRTDPGLVALIVGDGPERAALEHAAQTLGIAGAVRWLGYREDMPALYQALDLACLPSTFGEGFPNVLAEALACGVPVVATDVGGAKEVVGPHGIVVEPGDPVALERGLVAALRERSRGALSWPVPGAWERIDREFSTRALVAGTEDCLWRVVHGDAVHVGGDG